MFVVNCQRNLQVQGFGRVSAIGQQIDSFLFRRVPVLQTRSNSTHTYWTEYCAFFKQNLDGWEGGSIRQCQELDVRVDLLNINTFSMPAAK